MGVMLYDATSAYSLLFFEMLCCRSRLLCGAGYGYKNVVLVTFLSSEGRKPTLQDKKKGMPAFALRVLNTDEFKP